MKKSSKLIRLLLIVFLFILLAGGHPPSVLAEILELNPSIDSYINNGPTYLNTNFGSAHSLIVSNDRFSRLSLLQFDLASLPQQAIIDSAELKLYLYSTTGDSPVPIRVGRITKKWLEVEVTHANKPGIEVQEDSEINIDNSPNYKSWLVTSLIKEFVTQKFPNYGLSLSNDEGNYSLSFRSQEFGSNPPLLLITYHLPGVTPEVSPEEPTLFPQIISPSPTSTTSPLRKSNPIIISGLALLTIFVSTIVCAFYFIIGISK